MAVVEVPDVKIEKIGLKPFHEFDQANETWPRGDRPAAIREAAAEFRARFATPENRVRGVGNVVLIDGDVELGKGVALVWTPGHTDGNHSLVINTEEGVWVSSENGVAADSWHPHLSRIPGIRKTAEFFGREVILNSNTLEDSIDQYDSMVKEKSLADPNRNDPRWMNVFPSSEMPAWKRQWPIVPSFEYHRIEYGAIQQPALA